MKLPASREVGHVAFVVLIERGAAEMHRQSLKNRRKVDVDNILNEFNQSEGTLEL